MSFLLLVEGNIFLYESVIFQSVETTCSHPWHIFLLVCSTFLMDCGTLFILLVKLRLSSFTVHKNHLEGLLFIWHFTDKCQTWPRTQHTNSCPYLYSCASCYLHPHYCTWWNQVHYLLITSSKRPSRSIAFFSFTQRESSGQRMLSVISWTGKR